MIHAKINYNLPRHTPPQGTREGYPYHGRSCRRRFMMWRRLSSMVRVPLAGTLVLGRMGVFLALIIFILSLICSACIPTSTPINTTTNPLALLVPGTLTIASDISNPPLEFFDTTTQQPTGFDLDLITAIAHHLGLKVTILNTKIEILVSDLANKRYDVAISALPITPNLQSKANTIPYYTIGESLVVQAGNPQHIRTLADVCGLAVGVQDSSQAQVDLQNASNLCQQQGKPAISLTVLKNQLQLMQLLAAHHVVATFQDSATSDYMLHLYPGQFALGSPVLNASPLGIAISKDSTPLTTAIQSTLNTLKSDGTYGQLIAKWGLTNEATSLHSIRVAARDTLIAVDGWPWRTN